MIGLYFRLEKLLISSLLFGVAGFAGACITGYIDPIGYLWKKYMPKAPVLKERHLANKKSTGKISVRNGENNNDYVKSQSDNREREARNFDFDSLNNRIDSLFDKQDNITIINNNSDNSMSWTDYAKITAICTVVALIILYFLEKEEVAQIVRYDLTPIDQKQEQKEESVGEQSRADMRMKKKQIGLAWKSIYVKPFYVKKSQKGKQETLMTMYSENLKDGFNQFNPTQDKAIKDAIENQKNNKIKVAKARQDRELVQKKRQELLSAKKKAIEKEREERKQELARIKEMEQEELRRQKEAREEEKKRRLVAKKEQEELLEAKKKAIKKEKQEKKEHLAKIKEEEEKKLLEQKKVREEEKKARELRHQKNEQKEKKRKPSKYKENHQAHQNDVKKWKGIREELEKLSKSSLAKDFLDFIEKQELLKAKKKRERERNSKVESSKINNVKSAKNGIRTNLMIPSDQKTDDSQQVRVPVKNTGNEFIEANPVIDKSRLSIIKDDSNEMNSLSTDDLEIEIEDANKSDSFESDDEMESDSSDSENDSGFSSSDESNEDDDNNNEEQGSGGDEKKEEERFFGSKQRVETCESYRSVDPKKAAIEVLVEGGRATAQSVLAPEVTRQVVEKTIEVVIDAGQQEIVEEFAEEVVEYSTNGIYGWFRHMVETMSNDDANWSRVMNGLPEVSQQEVVDKLVKEGAMIKEVVGEKITKEVVQEYVAPTIKEEVVKNAVWSSLSEAGKQLLASSLLGSVVNVGMEGWKARGRYKAKQNSWGGFMSDKRSNNNTEEKESCLKYVTKEVYRKKGELGAKTLGSAVGSAVVTTGLGLLGVSPIGWPIFFAGIGASIVGGIGGGKIGKYLDGNTKKEPQKQPKRINYQRKRPTYISRQQRRKQYEQRYG